MQRRDGSFEIDEAEIGLTENIGDAGEQDVPAGVVVRRGSCRTSGLRLCGGGLSDGLVRDDVSGGGESDAAEFTRIGGRCGCFGGCDLAAAMGDDEPRTGEGHEERYAVGDI